MTGDGYFKFKALIIIPNLENLKLFNLKLFKSKLQIKTSRNWGPKSKLFNSKLASFKTDFDVFQTD